MLQVNSNPFPVLSTERLILRALSLKDAHDIFMMRSDKNLMKYIDRPIAASLEDAKQLIEKIIKAGKDSDGITWCISQKNSTKLIGTIGFWRILKEHYRAEIGYMLNANFHGKGIMQEAFTAVLNYGFNVMKLHSVEANVNPENAASIKILEKNYFIREGYFKENYFYNGRFLDSVIYSLLAS